jgi:hypothetical protein
MYLIQVIQSRSRKKYLRLRGARVGAGAERNNFDSATLLFLLGFIPVFQEQYLLGRQVLQVQSQSATDSLDSSG